MIVNRISCSFRIVFILLAGFSLQFCSVSGAYVRDSAARTETQQQPIARLLLIGDAGSATSDQPLWATVQKKVALAPAITKVIYLGDNVYEDGLPEISEGDHNYDEYTGILDVQIDAARAAKSTIFLPGNHDWARGAANGKNRVLAQQKYVLTHGADFLPRNGCPDVASEAIGKNTLLLYLDSQAIIDLMAGIEHDNANCRFKSIDQLSTRIAALTAGYQKPGKTVFLMAHHPLRTIGPHGGYYSWHHHVFPVYNYNKYVPLPIFASLIVWFRQLGWISSTDIAHPHYQNYIKFVQQISSRWNKVLLAAGHDHNVQVIQTGNSGKPMQLVSGSGSKSDIVLKHPDTLAATVEHALLQVDLFEDAPMRITLILADGNSIPVNN